MTNWRNINEKMTDRGTGSTERSNKGCWGTQRPVTAESYHQGPRRRDGITSVQWELKPYRKCRLAGPLVTEGGTQSQNYDPKWKGRRWEPNLFLLLPSNLLLVLPIGRTWSKVIGKGVLVTQFIVWLQCWEQTDSEQEVGVGGGMENNQGRGPT